MAACRRSTSTTTSSPTRRKTSGWRRGSTRTTPNDVPPATDTPPLDTDIRDTEQYQEERAEIRREEDKDELLVEGEREEFPPTRYDE